MFNNLFSKAPSKSDEISCPYCGSILETIPERKKKCPACGNLIYPKNDYLSKKKLLMTEEQAINYDQERDAYYERKKIIKMIEEIGFSEKDYYRVKDDLRKQYGHEASDKDIYWRFSNERLGILMKKADFQQMKMIYYHQAIFLAEENRDFRAVLKESARCELLNYQISGVVTKVEILACGNSCEQCKSINGRVLTIKQALQEMPLPHPNCTSTIVSEKPGFCRCIYTAII